MSNYRNPRIMICIDAEYYKLFQEIKKQEHIPTDSMMGRIMIEKYISSYLTSRGLTIDTNSIDYDKL